MKKSVTLLAQQNSDIFRNSTNTNFSVLLDTSLDIYYQIPHTFLTLSQIIIPTDQRETSVDGHILYLSCSLANHRTVHNGNYSDIIKVLYLNQTNFNTFSYNLTFHPRHFLQLKTTTSEQSQKVSFSLHGNENPNGETNLNTLLNNINSCSRPTIVEFLKTKHMHPSLHPLQRGASTHFHINQDEMTSQRFVLNSHDDKSQNHRGLRPNTSFDFKIKLPRPINIREEEVWSLTLDSLFVHKHGLPVFPLKLPGNFFSYSVVKLYEKENYRDSTFIDHVWRRLYLPEKEIHSDQELVQFLNNELITRRMIEPNGLATRIKGQFALVNENNQMCIKYSYPYGTGRPIQPLDEEENIATADAGSVKIIDYILVLHKENFRNFIGFTHEDYAGGPNNLIAFSLWGVRHEKSEKYFSHNTIRQTTTSNSPIFRTISRHEPLVVHCDLVKSNSTIGKNFTKMLRVVQGENPVTNKSNYIIHEEFKQALAIEIETKYFDSIHLKITPISTSDFNINDKYYLHNSFVQTTAVLTLERQM